jgi:hypothetical protein
MISYIFVTATLFSISLYGIATGNILVVGFAFMGYYINDQMVKE